MSQPNVDDAPTVGTQPPSGYESSASPTLATPTPGPYPTEPKALARYRSEPGDEKEFVKLRREFRDSEDWRALASLLVVHATHMQAEGDPRGKAAELCIQAYELWLERVKDRAAAGHALARAVVLRPDNARAQERLRKLYESDGDRSALVNLLRWQLTQATEPSDVAQRNIELGNLLDHEMLCTGEAVKHYQRALDADPTRLDAAGRLGELYLAAGAFDRASETMNAELTHLSAGKDPHRVAELHRRLAEIESTQRHNVPGAARHLQAALKVVPDDIAALRSFGLLYLSSGKAADGGAAKAADIFYKAAELARRRGDNDRALRLLRRALVLAPDHQQASAALENTLIDAEDWLALDDLYREWLLYFSGPDAVPLQLRRADLLDQRLYRREEARVLYEEASRHQDPDGESWKRLESIYADAGDHHALASLLEAQIERQPNDVSTETLLRTALLYRDELGADERAAVFFYKVLEREPFNAEAFEGYKEHWRRKHNWGHLRDLILYQIEQAGAYEEGGPLDDPAFAEEFVELAEICERRLGDVDGALESWTHLQEVYPGDPRPPKNLARIEKRARMWDNMVRVQEAELERTVDPRKRLDILKRLTQVYRDRQVNPTRAIELYNEILELSPGDVQATRALTSLYDRAGDFQHVISLLRDQYERSRSHTEQVALLRRMAELWHHELEMPDEAVWASEQILEHTPGDREALARLQQILEEEGRFVDLLTALDRELKHAANKEGRSKLLRRMARIAERELGDDLRAAKFWGELLELDSTNLEVVDRVIAVYEDAGRYEELGALLTDTASSPQTPVIRQVDYLLRLAQLAESSLDDSELAKSSFERVQRARPDHRGALEALVRIYRNEQMWQPLVAVLGKLQELAETDDDAFRIAWERSEILAEQLADPDGAIGVLEQIASDTAIGNQEVARTLLEYYERAHRPRDVVRQAELLLLAADETDARHRLYGIIARTWLGPLGDKQAALSAYDRCAREFPSDPAVLDSLSALQIDIGDFAGALATLTRRLDITPDVEAQTETLERMARVAEDRLGDPVRALDYLGQALARDPGHERLLEQARATARSYGLWAQLLGLLDARFDQMAQLGDVLGQIEVCYEASELAEGQLSDPDRAMDWARRGYFVTIEEQRDGTDGFARLRSLAAEHDRWPRLASIIEEEIDKHAERGTIDSGNFDLVGRLVEAADIALDRLTDGPRAVAYLQRAHRHRPGDEELAKRLETTAETHQLWPALIELWGGRLERAVTDTGRFEACCAIARLYEEELDDPEKAFEWLAQAWRDLRANDASLSRDAFERLLGLAQRHRLWPQLAEHYLGRGRDALSAGDGDEALSTLRSAAEVFDDRLEDPVGALRVLAAALDHDAGGQTLLDEIRRLGVKIDERRSGDMPALGAYLQLGVLQQVIVGLHDESASVPLLEERARIREERLDDAEGAMAEWFRVHRCADDPEPALVELERLADEADLWSRFLVLPTSQLEASRGDTDAQASLLKRIAQLYEGPLERPEYALRARLAAWRREPELPERGEPLDDAHEAIWRLAEQTGAYLTPPVPRDPLLFPQLTVPELVDLDTLHKSGLDIQRLLTELPSPHSPKLDLAAPAAVPGRITEEISISSLVRDTESRKTPTPSNETAQVDVADIMEIDEVELLDEELVELVEGVDLVQSVDDEGTISMAKGSKPPVLEASTVAVSSPHRPPPPPPRTADAGLPALPRLNAPVLPPRPRVPSAWDEVANAYAEASSNATDPVTVELVLARLWEDGAHNVEAAFAAHERALLATPEDPLALASLAELAERHNVFDRLRQAYEFLLSEATMPEHLVAHNLRLARLAESRDALEVAEQRYRAVLEVSPMHVDALSRLGRLYEAQGRDGDYVSNFAELLEAELDDLTEDDRVGRTLELAALLHTRLRKNAEAIDRLELLVRQYPTRRDAHEAYIDMLIADRRWQPAIDAMRNAWDALDDQQFRYETLAQVAMIYEERLSLPDRAIHAWSELAQAQDDPQLPEELLDHALGRLQELYFEGARWESLPALIEQRLARTETDDTEIRISLLVAKARVLQEGLGDEKGATATLEQLLAEAPDNDEVALGLSRLYRKQGRFDEGIAVLRSRLTAARAHADGDAPAQPDGEDDDAPRRTIALAVALADVLAEDGHDPKGAMEVIAEALERDPADTQLLTRRVDLARELHDLPVLGEALQELGSPENILEAADLLRRRLGDGARAMRLYSRVLADAKRDAEDPANADRLARALEGLVALRVEDDDTAGAMEFMDRQLAELTGSAIRAQLLSEMGRITYRSTGDVDAARERFDAALREDPEFVRARLGMSRILIEAEEFGEAERLLEPAVDDLGLAGSSEDLVDGLLLLARVFEATGRSGEAYRRLTTALRHDPENLHIRYAVVRNRYDAHRHRDAVTAADHVEQLLAEGVERTSRTSRVLSETFVVAALAERELGRPGASLDRYRRAVELDPSNTDALDPLIGLCQERGLLYEAARYANKLAKQTEDESLRGQRYIDAGMLFHDAAAAVSDGADPAEGETEADLRKATFENLRLGLELLEGTQTPLVDPRQLEIAFRSAAEHDAGTALRCLDRLLLHDEDVPAHRHDLLLEGVRVALDADEHLDAAEVYAAKARELVEDSAPAVLAQARVLEATDRVDEIEALVEEFFAGSSASDDDIETRVTLLLRLAELQRTRPEKAIGSLERASALDPTALGADDRRQLAALYEAAGTEGDQVLENHRELLATDPLYEPSLAALAHHTWTSGRLDHAWALYQVLQIADPGNEPARLFLEAHEVSAAGNDALNVDALLPKRSADGGVGRVLELLWEGGGSVIADHVARLDVPADARVSPLGDTPLSVAWAEMLKRLGQSKVALVDADKYEIEAVTEPDGVAGSDMFCVQYQHPPVILARQPAAALPDGPALRFALARALYFTGPQSVFAAGLPRLRLATLVSAALQAYHPRHARRKHHHKGEDEVSRLSQELVRKLPRKVGRELGQVFKDHVDEPFDSRAWRSWIAQGGNRVGLAIGGDLRAALETLLSAEDLQPESLRERVAVDAEIRDLVSFAASGTFVRARVGLGCRVSAK
jgi:tetratricopeptide (TPR) repeat protein